MERIDQFFKRWASYTPEFREAVEIAKEERLREEINSEEYNPITGEYEPNPIHELLNLQIPLKNYIESPRRND